MSSSVDILGQWITLPDPDSVASLSNRYYGECTTLADAKSQLSAIGSPQAAAQWTGLAAGTFATRLGALPGELEQAWQSYNAVARALSSYSSNLRPVVAALRSLAYTAEEAEGTLNATQAARDQAIQTGQESASGVWNTKLEEAKAAVSQLAGRRSSLLAELDESSAECVRQIRQAGPESVHQDLLSDLGRYAVDAGHLILRAEYDQGRFEFMVAKDLYYQPFDSLYDDFKKGDWDPTKWDAAKWGKVLSDVSGALGLVALVIAPIPGLDFADGILVPAAMGFGLAAAGFTTAARLKHEQGATWTDVAVDVGGVALMGGGNAIGQGIKLAAPLADGDDAEVAGTSLWESGAKNFFNLSDPAPGATIGTRINDAFDADGNLGVDEDTPSSQHALEHVEFGLDRAGDALNVWYDQTQHQSSGS
jgi:hypothetical protein